MHKRKADIKDGKQPEIKKIANHTFRELAEEYIPWCERQRGIKQKKLIIKQLTTMYGNLPLRYFNTRIVEQYQTERMKKGNKPATVNNHLATIKHMFTKAVDWNMVEEEVLKRIRKVKLLEANNRRLRFLSKEECNSLLDECAFHLKSIVTTALNTGMRKEEILSLKWDNVDLKHGFILLDKTKNGERREIPINQKLRETISRIIPRLDVPYVFYNLKSGNRYQRVTRSFATACRRAGIRDFKFHDLRHTFASHLVMAGIDLTTVRELLGHKTLTMTLRYAHLAPSHKVKAVDILENAINENSTIQKLYNQGINNNV